MAIYLTYKKKFDFLKNSHERKFRVKKIKKKIVLDIQIQLRSTAFIQKSSLLKKNKARG